jgi:phosphatidylglycerophosphatase A
MRRFAVFVCSFGYVGFFPFAPGTFGSAAGILLYVICRSAGILYLEVPIIVALLVLGVVFTVPAEKALDCIDPGPIVIDEVMGMMITLALLPVGWGGMLLGFLLFRMLDVFKPFPARQLEHLHGGFGVMLDDAMAAIYANLLLRGVYHLAPSWIS